MTRSSDPPTPRVLADWLEAWWTRACRGPKVRFVMENQPPPVAANAAFVEHPRLMLCLQGERRYRSTGDPSVQHRITAGQGLYFAPGTWIAPVPLTGFQSLGVHWEPHHTRLVLRQDELRAAPFAVWTIPADAQSDRWPERVRKAVTSGHSTCLPAAVVLTRLGGLIETLAGSALQRTPRRRQRFLAIRAYLEEHFSESHTRESVAGRFRVSAGHLTRLFREEGGDGFQETLETFRLREAERLLRTGEFTVQETALRCGFRDAGYFSRVFRARHGISPRRFDEG